ncbi:unnamed protein product, partial [Prorocentrum cordatum]
AIGLAAPRLLCKRADLKPNEPAFYKLVESAMHIKSECVSCGFTEVSDASGVVTLFDSYLNEMARRAFEAASSDDLGLKAAALTSDQAMTLQVLVQGPNSHRVEVGLSACAFFQSTGLAAVCPFLGPNSASLTQWRGGVALAKVIHCNGLCNSGVGTLSRAALVDRAAPRKDFWAAAGRAETNVLATLGKSMQEGAMNALSARLCSAFMAISRGRASAIARGGKTLLNDSVDAMIKA